MRSLAIIFHMICGDQLYVIFDGHLYVIYDHLFVIFDDHICVIFDDYLHSHDDISLSRRLAGVPWL